MRDGIIVDMKDKIILISSIIVGLSLVLSAIIYSCASSRNRYDFKYNNSKVLILDKKTGSLYISDGRQVKEIRVSDKRIHDYVNGEDFAEAYDYLKKKSKQ